jgi:tRNA(Arg) A34 adenosine deaminase TadA
MNPAGHDGPFSLEQAVPLLQRTPSVLRTLLAGLPEPWVRATEGEGTWSPFDVVGHLIHGERTDWMPRVELILAHGESRTFAPFDRFAQFTASQGQTLDQLLDIFAELRAENLRRLSRLRLSPRDLQRTGRHPELGVVTLRQHLSTWVAHDLSHLAQVARVMGRRYREEIGPWRAYLPMLGRPDPLAAPAWVDQIVEWHRPYVDDDARMELAIRLSRENVLRKQGVPFAAVVFDSESGIPVAVGTNSVTRLNNSVLHGEIVALILAQQRVGSFTLAAPGQPARELVSSCEPCAMCLGAILWSGVRRLVCGSTRADAAALGFDQGPVSPESYAYLRARGIAIVREQRRADAAEVLELYRRSGGPVYNG